MSNPPRRPITGVFDQEPAAENVPAADDVRALAQAVTNLVGQLEAIARAGQGRDYAIGELRGLVDSLNDRVDLFLKEHRVQLTEQELGGFRSAAERDKYRAWAFSWVKRIVMGSAAVFTAMYAMRDWIAAIWAGFLRAVGAPP